MEINKLKNSEQGKGKQMEAYAALAKAYLKLSNNESAQFNLDQYYNLAKELRNNNAQSDAALLLAQLFQKKGNTQKSLEYYQ